MILLGRCIQERTRSTDDGMLQEYTTTKGSTLKRAGSPSVELAQQLTRTRKVSDLDMMDNDKNNELHTDCDDAPMTTAKDICRFSSFLDQESTTNLDKVHFHLSRHDLPPLLEASIATESRLRSLALSLCQDLFLSFSDECLRSFFGYRSPSISREHFLLPMLADYLFVTSHALFAWEATQREMAVTQDGRTPEQRNAYIRETLFDARTLESLGGWEWSSLFRQAVHWLSSTETATHLQPVQRWNS